MENNYTEEDLLPLSGLQHIAFCERQWALIHIEQQWNENMKTAEGRVMHERVHDPAYKAHKPGVIVVRGMRLQSFTLGLYGVADIVEFVKSADSHGINLQNKEGYYIPRPVEYKRGRSKQGDYDRYQLCAQAMCLEEMMNCRIDEGDLYYGETRRREAVKFDDKLRYEVQTIAEKMHLLYKEKITPQPKMKPSMCKKCSMENICVPKLRVKTSGTDYWKDILGDLSTVDI